LADGVATPSAKISACTLDFTFAVLFDQRTRRDYFQTSVIEWLWREHRDGRHVWDEQIWLLLNFELMRLRIPASSGKGSALLG